MWILNDQYRLHSYIGKEKLILSKDSDIIEAACIECMAHIKQSIICIE